MSDIELIFRVLWKMIKIWGTCFIFSLPFLIGLGIYIIKREPRRK